MDKETAPVSGASAVGPRIGLGYLIVGVALALIGTVLEQPHKVHYFQKNLKKSVPGGRLRLAVESKKRSGHE